MTGFGEEGCGSMAHVAGTSEFLVAVNARAQEVLHVVLHDPDGRPSIGQRTSGLLVLATEVVVEWMGVLSMDALTNEVPSDRQLGCRAAQLEVVDVHNQK